MPQIPCRSPVHRLWCHRGRLQNCHRIAIETIWNVLDRPRSQLHPRPPMQPAEPQIRGLLGIPAGRMTHFTNMSHTRVAFWVCTSRRRGFIICSYECLTSTSFWPMDVNSLDSNAADSVLDAHPLAPRFVREAMCNLLRSRPAIPVRIIHYRA